MKKQIFTASLISCVSVFLVTVLITVGYMYSTYPSKYTAMYSSLISGVFAILCDIWLIVLLMFALSIAISLVLSFWISKIIENSINEINIENPDKESVKPEFLPFVNRLIAQNEQIVKQMEEIKAEHESKDEMRKEFTANVSHELKTPLTSISGYAEIIKTGIAKPDDVTRFSGKIYDESQRLIRLVGDIINLSKLESSQVAHQTEKIDLFEVCEDIITHLEQSAEKKNITMLVSGERSVINGVRQIVEEMIYNICDNAIKYNVENGSVNINIKQYIDGVELSVSDTGIGIPKEDLDRVFERFYRVDKSHSKEIGGTGLGLSIVKHGANFHNASLTIESEVNKGTTVRVIF